MHHKIKGIIIRENAQGESSKLLTVLTELDGVILVKAKGARNISATNLKNVQLFACSNMLLYLKNESYTLVDAELIEDFYAVRENIESLALASYLCEVAGSVSVRGSDNSAVLQLLLNSLYALSRGMATLKHIKAVFEVRLASILGFEPEINNCDACEKTLDSVKNRVLDPENGVFMCEECSDELIESGEVDKKGIFSVSQSIFDAFKYIFGAKSNKIFSFSLGEKDLDELNTLSEIYLHLRLDRKYKTLDFLKTLM
ncbi:MAG TPA: DNA repair protein RecO [Clostridiales bacterium]|nr:DNA repair protein RecO [Clostridiales bacterium]